MKRRILALLRLLWVPVFLFLTVVLLWSELELSVYLQKDRLIWSFSAAFLLGSFIFTLGPRFIPLYVFGHELTHWFVAKLFFKETGKFKCSGSSGYVEIKNPNLWIILAPYFLPFYFLLLTGFWGVIDFFVAEIPSQLQILTAALLGLSYSYHLVLTFIALSKGQLDLKRKGKIFSLSLILLMNTVFFYLATLTFTKQWKRGWNSFTEKTQILSEKTFLKYLPDFRD